MRRLMILVLASVFATTLGIGAQAPIDPNRFEPNIQKFEAVEDGLHMTPEGYKAWTQMLRPHLK